MGLRTFVNWWMWCLVTDSSCSTWGRRLTVRSRVSSASVSKDWVRETTCTARSCWAHSPRGGLTESFLLAWGELVARGAQKIADQVEGAPLRLRWPRVSCWMRRRTSPWASPASVTMWKVSRTLMRPWNRSSNSVVAASPLGGV